MISNLQKYATQKIQLTAAVNFVSSKDVNKNQQYRIYVI